MSKQMHTYQLEVVSENSIPHDVLVEHLAVALQSFQFAGFTSVALRGSTMTLEHKMESKVAHPFDNPENVVFDDEPQAEGYTGPNGGYTTANEGSFSPLASQSCVIPGMPEDPYPLLTRVLDNLKERNERG